MKFYTSYFYQVRFFPPNVIPLSTAMFDPKWFHENQGQEHWFIDKRGVVNGLRIPPFVPGRTTEDLIGEDFLKAYKIQLNTLDFDNIMQRFSNFAEKFQKDFNVEGEPIFVLLVHEAPDNPNSERVVIQDWFKERGISCEEFIVKT